VVTQALDGLVQVVHREGNDRKTLRDRVLRKPGASFEDCQIDTTQVEVGAIAMMWQKAQPDDIPVKVGCGRYIFSPQ
jgi:hypothetical protein